ncbi:MAG TPA: GNAT family N-acetyltransferase [Patescibacteria group bacterium]|nr:GNAT family N-acetyltransferase [Patescibacteria group bacterium]
MMAEDIAQVALLAGQLGYPSTPDQIASRFRSLETIPGSAIFVAELTQGSPAGWAHVVGRQLLESEPFAELVGLVVDAASRRQGAGRALVKAAESWARENGYGALRIRSNTARSEARPFYEKMGYVIGKTQYVFNKPVS